MKKPVELDANGKITVTVGADTAELVAEDLLIETVQGGRYVSLSDGGITVALDTELTYIVFLAALLDRDDAALP